MIRSQLSNVTDSYDKSLLAQAGLTLELHFSVTRLGGPILRFRGTTDYLRGLFLCVRVSDYWWCPSIFYAAISIYAVSKI